MKMLSMKGLIPAVLIVGVLLVLAILVVPTITHERYQRHFLGNYEIMLTLANTLDRGEGSKIRESEILELIGKYEDAFTGRPFRFFMEKGEDFDWFIVSVGPDGQLNPAEDGIIPWLPYDPTNGLVSSGDIVFGRFLTPARYDIGPLPRRLGRIKGTRSGENGSWKKGFGGFIYEPRE